MITLLLTLYQGTLSRLAGNGFGKQWNVPWLPEVLFALPFGLAFAYGLSLFTGFWWTMLGGALAWGWSYLFMQSGTWLFLKWEGHDNPGTKRSATLKHIVDWIADKLGYKLGDEGYSWVAAGVKGFLIGLPVGGIPLAILWPVGYEIGSHAKGRVEQFGIDPHALSEVFAGIGAGLSIAIYLVLLGV